MVFDNTHNHTFESITAASAEPWLREMTQNTFRLATPAVDEIFGVKEDELAGLEVDGGFGVKGIARAQIFLLRTPQPQSEVFKQTSAIAVGFSRIDPDNILRFFISHLARRKKHAPECMDGFLDQIEATARLSIAENELACSGVLTVVKGNFLSDTFTDRGYVPEQQVLPDFAPVYRLILPKLHRHHYK